MDPQRVKDVYERLELLDDRLGHRLRARGVELDAHVVHAALDDLIQLATER